MLKIRQEQLATLGANVEKKFKRQMCVQLRAEHVRETAVFDEKQLTEFVDQGVANAKKYDIDVKRDVADYLVILLNHGVNFEKQPANEWALEILNDPDMHGGTKILQLETQFEKQESQRG